MLVRSLVNLKKGDPWPGTINPWTTHGQTLYADAVPRVARVGYPSVSSADPLVKHAWVVRGLEVLTHGSPMGYARF